MTTLVPAHPARVPVGHEPAADEAITGDRDELKYLVPYRVLGALAGELNRRLPPHHYTGKGANPLPDPHHYVTTVYFDTGSRRHYLAARDHTATDLKVRAKVYYDLHPSLAEIATDASQIVHAPETLFFEVKRRSGARTSKSRFRLRRADVPAFFAEHRIPAPSRSLSPEGSPDADAATATLAYCEALEEPLVASCIVNYRRLSWQDAAGELRVTMDLGLGYYAVPADVWTRPHALERAQLGAPAARELRAVLEVKRRGALPAWLAGVLAEHGLEAQPFSKFVAASEAVDARR